LDTFLPRPAYDDARRGRRTKRRTKRRRRRVGEVQVILNNILK
jgi:hypothetical protein